MSSYLLFHEFQFPPRKRKVFKSTNGSEKHAVDLSDSASEEHLNYKTQNTEFRQIVTRSNN